MKITIERVPNGYVITGEDVDASLPWVIEDREDITYSPKELLLSIVEIFGFYCSPYPVEVNILVKDKMESRHEPNEGDYDE